MEHSLTREDRHNGKNNERLNPYSNGTLSDYCNR